MKKSLFPAGAAVTLTSCQTIKTAETEDRFAAADINHDGKLSHHEAIAYLVPIIFNSRDANHGDGFVTKEEAQAYYASREGPPR
jgi:hypothetical protein